MNKNLLRAASVLLISSFSLVVSCKDDGEKKEEKTTSTAKGKQKKGGRIADRVNIVQIPLTAGELSLKGKVKDVIYKEYLVIPRSGDTMHRLMTSGHNVYDAQGRLVDQSEFEGEDYLKWQCKYTYDGDKALEWHFVFRPENKELHTVFQYDETGNIVSQTETDANGQTTGRKEFKYDANGNQVEEKAFNAKNELERTVTDKYDKDGNQIESAYNNADGTNFRMTAVYDAKGHKTSGVDYRDNAVESKWERKNNESGKATELIIYNKDGKLISKTTYKLDKMGNETEIIEESTGAIYTTTSTYEYDKEGNIIRQTDYEMKDGKSVPVTVFETKYTYHP